MSPILNLARFQGKKNDMSRQRRLFTELEAMQLEGMVCKRKDSVYAFARSKLCLKVKTASGRDEIQKRIETWAK